MNVLVRDPATAARDGSHPVYGDSADALNGNISRIFLTGVPQSVPTTRCRQPDGWSCGPYSLAECLGQGDGENARQWLINRGMITSAYGTEYAGIVGYLQACGYSCEYDGRAHDAEMSGFAFDSMIKHLQAGYKVILCMHGTGKGCRTNYWTSGGHYICVYGIEGDSGISVDGDWGPETTKKAQKVFGTTADGKISNQNNLMIGNLPNCYPSSWEFVKQEKLKDGSELIKAVQRMLGIAQDGFCGIETILKLQSFLGVETDGYVGGETVRAWQRWLNQR